MNRLISIELYKYKLSVALRVILIVMFSMMVVGAIGSYVFTSMFKADELAGDLLLGGYKQFCTTVAGFSTCITYFSIFLGIFICHDFNERTLQLQNNAGYSRNKIFISRLISVAILVLIVSIVYALMVLLFYSLFFGFGVAFTAQVLWKMLSLTFLGYLVEVATISLIVWLCFLIKSTGAVIGISMVYLTIGSSMLAILAALYKEADAILSWTIIGVLNNISGLSDISGKEYAQMLIVSIFTIALVVVCGCASFRKNELK